MHVHTMLIDDDWEVDHEADNSNQVKRERDTASAPPIAASSSSVSSGSGSDSGSSSWSLHNKYTSTVARDKSVRLLSEVEFRDIYLFFKQNMAQGLGVSQDQLVQKFGAANSHAILTI